MLWMPPQQTTSHCNLSSPAATSATYQLRNNDDDGFTSIWMKLSILLVMPSSAINFPLSSQAIRYLLYLVYHRCHKVEMIFQQIYIIYTCIFCRDSGFSRLHSLRHSSLKRQQGFGGRVQSGMGVDVPKSSGKFVLKC